MPLVSAVWAGVKRCVRYIAACPGVEELLEYEDCRKEPARAHADGFIQQAYEDFMEPKSRMENYLDYVAHRPLLELLLER